MRFEDYPPQEPGSPGAEVYRRTCIERSFGVPFTERRFGGDPHQSVAIYPAVVHGGPLFIFIHGGGWTGGYKETMAFMAPEFCRQGITFASLGYRLAPDHVFPVGLEDCATGLKLLYAAAGEFGYDQDRIFMGGHSAGGHYAALLAVRSDWQSRLGLPVDVIRGCLPISGVYRFGEGAGFAMRPRFLGPEDSGLDHAASPVMHIQQAPPFLIAYGEKDFPHLCRQAEEMAQALRAAGGYVETVVMPGRDHFTASLAGGEPNGPWVPKALGFLRQFPAVRAKLTATR
jgi:arylformamidase